MIWTGKMNKYYKSLLSIATYISDSKQYTGNNYKNKKKQNLANTNNENSTIPQARVKPTFVC